MKLKTATLISAFYLLFVAASAQVKSDLQKENLASGVKSVKVTMYVAIDKYGSVSKGGVMYSYTSTYNQQGNKLAEKHHPTDFNSGGDDTFIYNSKGKLLEENNYAKGELYVKTSYKYDSKGMCIEKVRLQTKDSNWMKTTYSYDATGNMIEESNFLMSGKLSFKTTFKYDSKGNMIEGANIKPDGTIVLRYTYAYDNKGNKIESSNYDSNGSLTSHSTSKYEFDATGSWIKKTEYGVSKAFNMIEREIQY